MNSQSFNESPKLSRPLLRIAIPGQVPTTDSMESMESIPYSIHQMPLPPTSRLSLVPVSSETPLIVPPILPTATPQTPEQPIAITPLIQQLTTNEEYIRQSNTQNSSQQTTSSILSTSATQKKPRVVIINSDSDEESDSTRIPTQDKGKGCAPNTPSPEPTETQLPLFLDSPTQTVPTHIQTSTAHLTHSFINVNTSPLKYNRFIEISKDIGQFKLILSEVEENDAKVFNYLVNHCNAL